jgi:hypothetical protein
MVLLSKVGSTNDDSNDHQALNWHSRQFASEAAAGGIHDQL